MGKGDHRAPNALEPFNLTIHSFLVEINIPLLFCVALLFRLAVQLEFICSTSSPLLPNTIQFLSQVASMSKTFTAKEVGEHKDEKSGMYIIVDSGVYDITSQ